MRIDTPFLFLIYSQESVYALLQRQGVGNQFSE